MNDLEHTGCLECWALHNLLKMPVKAVTSNVMAQGVSQALHECFVQACDSCKTSALLQAVGNMENMEIYAPVALGLLYGGSVSISMA